VPAKARATTRKPATRKPATSGSTTRRAKAASSKPKRVEITVEDLADFNESINGLVYGDSGVGKTPFVGGAPDAVFLGTEKGSISAKRFGSKAKLIRATSWDKLEAALAYLEENPDGFRWAIVDSVTKMQQLLLRHLLEKNVADGGKNADIDIPQIQDHQKWQNMFKRFIDRLIDLDINVVFVATAMHKEDAEGDDLVLPDLQGKDYQISQYVCAQMDFVYCLKTATNKKTEEPEWWLITKSRPPFFAKDRYNAVPSIVRAPDFGEIIEAIENSAAAAEPNANVQKRRGKGKAKEDVSESLDDEFEDDEDLDDDDEPEDEPDDDDIEDEDDDDIEDDEEDDEDDDEDDDEPPAKPARRKPVAATRRAKPASRLPKKVAPEPDDEDDDEDEDEEETKPAARRRTPRRSAKPSTKKPARKPAAKKAAEPDDDDDDFDPDDDEDLDFDDDEA
jgi:hypothetical protein